MAILNAVILAYLFFAKATTALPQLVNDDDTMYEGSPCCIPGGFRGDMSIGNVYKCCPAGEPQGPNQCCDSPNVCQVFGDGSDVDTSCKVITPSTTTQSYCYGKTSCPAGSNYCCPQSSSRGTDDCSEAGSDDNGNCCDADSICAVCATAGYEVCSLNEPSCDVNPTAEPCGPKGDDGCCAAGHCSTCSVGQTSCPFGNICKVNGESITDYADGACCDSWVACPNPTGSAFCCDGTNCLPMSSGQCCENVCCDKISDRDPTQCNVCTQEGWDICPTETQYCKDIETGILTKITNGCCPTTSICEASCPSPNQVCSSGQKCYNVNGGQTVSTDANDDDCCQMCCDSTLTMCSETLSESCCTGVSGTGFCTPVGKDTVNKCCPSCSFGSGYVPPSS